MTNLPTRAMRMKWRMMAMKLSPQQLCGGHQVTAVYCNVHSHSEAWLQRRVRIR